MHPLIIPLNRGCKGTVVGLPIGSGGYFVGSLRFELTCYRNPLVGGQRQIALGELMYVLSGTAVGGLYRKIFNRAVSMDKRGDIACLVIPSILNRDACTPALSLNLSDTFQSSSI